MNQMFYRSLNEFRDSNGYEVEGAWYPRVTSILSIKSKPALYAYYASMPSYKVATAATNRSAEEGTAVHTAVEAILRGEKPEISPSIQPSVDAFLQFYGNNLINPLKIEERIISKRHRYAGTIDVLAEVNGIVGVLDIKTSQAVYRDYGMQTAAYVQALSEDPNIPPLTSWVLRLDQKQTCERCSATLRMKGGNTKIKNDRFPCQHEWSVVKGEYEFKELDNYESNIRAFLAAKSLWEWEHEQWVHQLLHPLPESVVL
jgi:hypothetical protein